MPHVVFLTARGSTKSGVGLRVCRKDAGELGPGDRCGVDQRKQWAFVVTPAIMGSAVWERRPGPQRKALVFSCSPPNPEPSSHVGTHPWWREAAHRRWLHPSRHLLHDVCVRSCCLSMGKCKRFCIFYFCMPKFIKDYVR